MRKSLARQPILGNCSPPSSSNFPISNRIYGTKPGELAALDQQFPDLKSHLRDEAGEIRRFLNVYVNEEDIRFLGGNKYAFQDGDEVLLVPSIAGGTG